MGKLESFTIEFNDAQRVFAPGGTVSGRVLAVLSEDIKMRGVFLTVHGAAKTHWTETEHHSGHHHHHQPHPHATHHGGHQNRPMSETIPYHAKEVFIDMEIPLSTQVDDGEHAVLAAGEHCFPFTAVLPPNCLPSFNGTHGSIAYYCKARIDRPWRFDHTVKEMFTVLPTIDLNFSPELTVPQTVEASKSLGVLFFKAGHLLFKAEIPKGGFVPGEHIDVSLNVNNDSTRSVKEISTRLTQICTCHGLRRGHGELHIRDCARHMHIVKQPVQIAAHSTETLRLLVPIPAAVPSFSSASIVSVRYELSVWIEPSGLSTKLHGCLPVTIGTVPLMPDFYNAAVPMGIGAANGVNGATLNPNLLAPPSYEECMFGKKSTRSGSQGDTQWTRGSAEYAPKYSVYRQLSR